MMTRNKFAFIFFMSYNFILFIFIKIFSFIKTGSYLNLPLHTGAYTELSGNWPKFQKIAPSCIYNDFKWRVHFMFFVALDLMNAGVLQKSGFACSKPGFWPFPGQSLDFFKNVYVFYCTYVSEEIY